MSEKYTCESCEAAAEEVYQVDYYCMSYAVEWVCEICLGKKLTEDENEKEVACRRN